MTAAARRILFATTGTLGDLYPLLAIAIGLKARGHAPAIASGDSHRERIERHGIEFRRLRPDLAGHPQAGRMFETGDVDFSFREIVLPALRESYDDLAAAAEGAGLIVASPLVFAARLLHDQTGIPVMTASFAPFLYPSPTDPPVAPEAAALFKALTCTPALARWALDRGWLHHRDRRLRPLRELRRSLGLPIGAGYQFEDASDPLPDLALFSPVLGRPQPDWPADRRQTGFVFLDDATGPASLPAEVADFLAAGAPPIVVGLGSAAHVSNLAAMLEESIAAARALGRRALIVAGSRANREALAGRLPDGIAAVDYAPFSALFRRACVVIIHGGVGTTAEVLRAGRPMLVVPLGYDQPDNAARVERLGVARVVPPRRWRKSVIVAALRRLIEDPNHARRSAEVAAEIGREHGLEAACAAVLETAQAGRAAA